MGIQWTTVSPDAQMEKSFTRSGWSIKISPWAQQQLINEVIREARTSSKELQASVNLSVHDRVQRKPSWQKDHKGSSHVCRRHHLWRGETNLVKNNSILLTVLHTNSQTVVVWWSQAAWTWTTWWTHVFRNIYLWFRLNSDTFLVFLVKPASSQDDLSWTSWNVQY